MEDTKFHVREYCSNTAGIATITEMAWNRVGRNEAIAVIESAAMFRLHYTIIPWFILFIRGLPLVNNYVITIGCQEVNT